MAQLPPQKRKKRRVQLREAQRRRRARLKEESKSFLQIILDQETLQSLRFYSTTTGKPLHICAADLIRGGLNSHTKSVPQPTFPIVAEIVRERNVVPIDDTESEALSEPTL